MSSQTQTNKESEESKNDENPSRQPAIRVFAKELREAKIEVKKEHEKDKHNAPKFYLLPTGFLANRVVTVGTLTEVSEVEEAKTETYRGKVVDWSGEYYIYGNTAYSPEIKEMLKEVNQEGQDKLRPENIEHVMVIGKPALISGEYQKYVAVNPETLVFTTKETRERCELETAEQTRDRLNTFISGEAENQQEARQHYDFNEYMYKGEIEDKIMEFETDNENEPQTTPQQPTRA